VFRRVPKSLLAALSLICAFAARADPTEEEPALAAADSSYVAGKRAVDAREWHDAIRLLSKAALQDDRNPDIQNLLGYAHRNAGEVGAAFKHYGAALLLNPRHRGAHEYMGEAYLMIGNLPKAEEHLAALEKICLVPCDELEDLRRAIADYQRRRGR
jgi:Flp pilus assembly protein TadD